MCIMRIRRISFKFEYIDEIGFIFETNLGHEPEDKVGSFDEKKIGGKNSPATVV